jgi:hypothetical protein
MSPLPSLLVLHLSKKLLLVAIFAVCWAFFPINTFSVAAFAGLVSKIHVSWFRLVHVFNLAAGHGGVALSTYALQAFLMLSVVEGHRGAAKGGRCGQFNLFWAISKSGSGKSNNGTQCQYYVFHFNYLQQEF